MASPPHSEKPTFSALAVRRVRVADAETVWLRSILEAYDGLVQWSGDGTGVLTLSVPSSQADALDELLADLKREGSLHVLADARAVV